jgi:hypothetical protein
MTAGRWLDASTTTAREGHAALREHGLPAADLPAVLYARDRAWHRLANIADLIRGTTPMAVSLADAKQRLAEPYVQPIRILAAAARAAPIRSFGQSDHRPAAASPPARILVAAADHLATLGDLLATHLRPGPAQRGQRLYPQRDQEPHRRAAPGHLTAAGQAIAHGAEREQIVGELAQIARAWYAVDRTLADPAGPAAAHLPATVAQRLDTWLASPFGGLFDDYATIGRSSILRMLDVATDPARPAGPRSIAGIADVHRTLTDITSTLTRDPQQATIRLAGALARLGYVAHTRALRTQPGEQARQRLTAWRDLVVRLEELRHLRDQHQPALADEINRATAWLTRQPVAADGVGEPGGDIRPAVGDALRHTVTPLRRAVADNQILTTTWAITEQVYKGTHVAERTWVPANHRDPATHDALHHLADLARQPHTNADPAPAPDIQRQPENHNVSENDKATVQAGHNGVPGRQPPPATGAARPHRAAEPAGLEP